MKTKVTEVDLVTRSVKWSEMFESEEDLFCKLKEMDMKKFMGTTDTSFSYLYNFHKKEKLEDLSPKQLTQLKRLAKAVYKYHMNW